MIWNKAVYDLSDYVYTNTLSLGPTYEFLNDSITDLFSQRMGQDITKPLETLLATMDSETAAQNVNCINNLFYQGNVDFRKTARCQVQNYFLLAASCVIMVSMGLKCKFVRCRPCILTHAYPVLAALQLTPKRNPELQDKFVLCQVPCYTEGEESLRRTIDSLAALNYDDKRKLMFLICDGNIIGTGNDRTTPRIVLDVLGVDPKLDPEPLLFKSIGEGSKQLNYGKIYSGLYEFEGHVVPYVSVI